jgi:hypothetical protein
MIRGRARSRDERGLTAFELTVGVGIMLALTAGALTFFDSANKSIRASSNQTQSLDEARVALARIGHEIRGALAIHAASTQCPLSTCLTLKVQQGAATTDVRYSYDPAAGALNRAQGDVLTGVWGGETPVASGVRNGTTPVFSRNVGSTIGTAAAIEVVLNVSVDPSQPRDVIRLDSILTPRNL